MSSNKQPDLIIEDGGNFISNLAPLSPAVVTIGTGSKRPFIISIDGGWIDDETKKFMENSGIASVDHNGTVSIDFMSVIRRLEHIERLLEEKADWFQVDPTVNKKA